MNALAGKVAIVTGAGQGVGRGIALAMASAGASVVVVDQYVDRAVAAAGAVSARGVSALATVADVAIPDDARRAVEECIATFGRLDIVVNNAHEVIPGAVLDVTDDDIETLWSTGLLGVFNFMKAARPHLTRGASVINIVSSVMLKTDTSGFALYAATKNAIRSLTRTVAVEWGGDGIRVNALSPQTTSPAWEQWAAANRDAADTIVAEIPLGYLGQAERDVGPVAVFLASDAARYITGSVVLADGGRGHLR
jgi:NAD(P)-dependent dehydrogenase (short-subunit alcohol dehydrogenase family)